IYAICVLPEHIHMIIKPQKNCEFSKIIGTIKKHYTYNFNGASKDSTLCLQNLCA
ncbi:MAG: transposase, partial [Clostridia bacterium]|nr:transposase [Clostridia bacterium]